MSLILSIDKDLTESIKKKEADKTSTLRLLKNALKNRAIADKISEDKITDDVAITIIKQEIKKRKDSIEAFTEGNREELANKEKSEMELLQSYVPAMMSSEDIGKAVQEVVKENSLSEPYQFGQLMGLVMKKTSGRADGNDVKEQVQKYISSM